MPNNDIRYKLARLCILAFSVLSAVIVALRFLFLWAANRFFFLGANLVWLFADVGNDAYAVNGRVVTIVKTILYCTVLICAYLICWYFSKKRIGFLIGALFYFIFDSTFFILTTRNLKTFLIVGIVYRCLIVASLIIGWIYGRRAILSTFDEDADEAASAKFVNSTYSEELARVQREITISREKGLIGGHIQLRCFIDGKFVGDLKPKDEVKVSVDGNSHLLEIYGIYTAYQIEQVVDISEGNNNAAYKLSFNPKRILLKSKIVVQ